MLVGVSADAILAADHFPLATKLDRPASDEGFLPSLYLEAEKGQPSGHVAEVQPDGSRYEDLERPTETVPDAPASTEPSPEESIAAFWRTRRRTAAGFEFRPLDGLSIYPGSAGPTQTDLT